MRMNTVLNFMYTICIIATLSHSSLSMDLNKVEDTLVSKLNPFIQTNPLRGLARAFQIVHQQGVHVQPPRPPPIINRPPVADQAPQARMAPPQPRIQQQPPPPVVRPNIPHMAPPQPRIQQQPQPATDPWSVVLAGIFGHQDKEIPKPKDKVRLSPRPTIRVGGFLSSCGFYPDKVDLEVSS